MCYQFLKIDKINQYDVCIVVLMDIEEFDLDKITNYGNYPNFHNKVSQKYPMWNPGSLRSFDIELHTCNLCKFIYIYNVRRKKHMYDM